MRMRERESERLKEQVAIQTEALNRSLLYANEENRRKTETLSYVGHDLRAPLATIVGYARMLQAGRSEEHTSELQSLMRTSYAVFCLKNKTTHHYNTKYKLIK